MRYFAGFLRPWAVAALLATAAVTNVHADDPPAAIGEVADLARRAAGPILKEIRAATPPAVDRPRVVLLPVGDRDGRVTPLVAESAFALRGELTRALRASEGGDRLVVLSVESLRQAARDAGEDFSLLPEADADRAKALMSLAGADVAVFGRFDAISTRELREGLRDELAVDFRVVSPKGEARPVRVSGPVEALVPLGAQAGRSGRFRVRLLIDGKPVELKMGKPESDFQGVLVAELDPAVVNPHRSVEFAVELANLGAPEVLIRNRTLDRQRLYGVALIVDGVNAASQRNGTRTGVRDFVETAAVNAQKFVLCGPGEWVVPAGEGGKYQLVAANQANPSGGSVQVIWGFQDGPNVARAFTFADASCSVAHKAGLPTVVVGRIDVHFFPQVLDGDITSQNALALGAMAGRSVKQRTFKIDLEHYPKPVESWRILYYVKSDQPPAIPVAG